MSNSPLVQYTRLSPNCNKPRNHKIDTITIHHMAGVLSVETCGNIFANPSRQASSNYAIGSDGRIAMYVEECNRSWCSSSAANDHRAITIEVSNSQNGGNWPVSDYVLSRLIDLCVDICKRNDISRLNFTGNTSGNLTMHKWFAATACPGPYLESKFPYIAEQVNKRLAGDTPTPTPTPTGRKYRAGDRVSFTGVLYADSFGGGPGQSRTNLITEISRVNNDARATKPYLINNGLGWVAEADLTPIGGGTSEIKPGDSVIINGVGTASSGGSGARTRNYTETAAKVIYVRDGAVNPYACNCNNNMNGVTGWFSKGSVRKV